MERKFSLPNIEDLTKQQETIRALPSEGKYLIVGGPGTGKSVVALFRVKKLQRENKQCVCLAYNKLLITSNAQLAQEEIQSKQWQSWFNEIYRGIFKRGTPRVKTEDSFKPYDWSLILTQIEEYCQSDGEKTDFSEQYLVIDEGQDMPPEFYQSLMKLGFKHFFVVADQNQRIAQNNSSIKELMNILDLDGGDIYDLVDNYRNTYAIAKLSEYFFTDAGSEKPELPAQSFNSQKPVLFGYENGHHNERFRQIIRRIVNNAKERPNHLIGVISPKNEISDLYYQHIISHIGQLAENIIVSRHYGNYKEHIEFNKGGIAILNAQGCKGLEFDMVFLTDLNHLYVNPKDPDTTRKLLYVMTSRAKYLLCLLIDKSNPFTDILNLLPNNDEILERYYV